MGNSLNSHEVFLTGLKESLRTRGIRVKRKDLRYFFTFIHETCPWFPLEGTIDHKQWKRVGDALQDFYRTFGPEKVPVSAFSYWNLIHDVLEVHSQDPDIKTIIKTGEKALREDSRPPSACPSVAVDILDEPIIPTNKSPEFQPDTESPNTHDKIDTQDIADPPKIPNIYPALTSFKWQTTRTFCSPVPGRDSASPASHFPASYTPDSYSPPKPYALGVGVVSIGLMNAVLKRILKVPPFHHSRETPRGASPWPHH